jgi:outer membrane protein assembly factor BamB
MKWSLAFVLGISLAQGIFADDWPHWRGPARTGISQEKGWLEQWPDQGPAIAWKAQVGLGFSSFVVAQGKAITVGHADEKDTVFCFDAASGKTIWKHSYPAELGDKYFEGGTTGSATIDGDHVYWLSRWGDFFCFNLADGKIVWERQLQKESETPLPTWGFTGATTVHGDMLLLNVGESGMAVDKKTGKTIWESGKKEAGYTTPLVVKRAGRAELLLANTQAYLAVDPATGKELWRMKWLTQYGVNAADPILVDDAVFISSGYGKGAALIKPASGEGEPATVWKGKALRTQMGAGILVGKYIYGVDGDTTEKATLKCIEAATGVEKWAHKNFGSGGLIVADGKLIALAAYGELFVAPATPDGFKPISQAQVLGPQCWTAPVLANGFVYCRNSKGDVVAVDLRKK